MSNVLRKTKQNQVVALGQLGWTVRRIQEETGVRRETVSKYLKRNGVAVRKPRGRLLPAEAKAASDHDGVITDSDAKAASQKVAVITDPDSKAASREAEVITDLVPRASPSASACEPYRDIIEDAVSKGRNAMSIWQELVDYHGIDFKYASVMRFVKKLRGEAGSRDAYPPIHSAPGEECQVDYGEGPMVRHPETGKYRRTRLFVLTLGNSRKSVRLLTFDSSSEIWCRLHERAFERLGGVTQTVVLDNLKEGVLKPDVYDPELNPLYQDFLFHYGVTALPCRVRHPDRKGKVESAVGHTQSTALKGLRFESLEEAQAYLDRWSERWADTRIHGTTKRQVSRMFEDEKPYLKPLPATPFSFYRYGHRTVHMDGTVEVERSYYSVPPGWIGRRMQVQWDALHVRILDPYTHTLLREHLRQKPGRYRVKEEDKSRKTPRTTVELLGRARRKGESVGTLCDIIHARNGQTGIRGIMGILSLSKNHGDENLNRACAAALEAEAPTYKAVRAWLERITEPQLTLKQVDPLIRELTHYRDVISKMTGETE